MKLVVSRQWPGAKAAGEAPEVGVGMLGYAFMGKAHSNAYKKIPYMMYPPPAVPVLAAICGRNAGRRRRGRQAIRLRDVLHRLARDARR